MILASLWFRQQARRCHRSAAASGLLVGLALVAAGACKPYAGDLEIRAVDCVRVLVEAPSDTRTLGAIALLPDGETPAMDKQLSIVLRFLWARHQQGAPMSYTLAERYRPEPGREHIVVDVGEAENPLLGRVRSSYAITVYFELEEDRSGEARVWRIRRLEAGSP